MKKHVALAKSFTSLYHCVTKCIPHFLLVSSCVGFLLLYTKYSNLRQHPHSSVGQRSDTERLGSLLRVSQAEIKVRLGLSAPPEVPKRNLLPSPFRVWIESSLCFCSTKSHVSLLPANQDLAQLLANPDL